LLDPPIRLFPVIVGIVDRPGQAPARRRRRVGPRPGQALYVSALVEQTAQIVWGAGAFGGPVRIPEDADKNFVGVYGCLRANPM
jgi:L-fuculose-phosphate aldolase